MYVMYGIYVCVCVCEEAVIGLIFSYSCVFYYFLLDYHV